MQEGIFMSCIIVLGCYRSGTSAVAGVLHHLGVFIGEFFDSPSPNNEKGYFEDIEFKNFHSKFDSGELNNTRLISDYVELIRKREKKELWGLKDPMLCNHLLTFCNKLETNHKLIVCRRPTEEISRSMGKALNQNNVRFLPLAEFYVAKMNEQIHQYEGPILELEHNETISNPTEQVQKIAEFVGVKVTEEALSHICKKKND